MQTKVEKSRKKTGGRQAGTVNKKTAQTVAAVEASGLTPLEYLLSVMRDAMEEPKQRLTAALGAAPYVHAKLASIEVSGKGGGPVVVSASLLDERL